MRRMDEDDEKYSWRGFSKMGTIGGFLERTNRFAYFFFVLRCLIAVFFLFWFLG